MLLCQEGKREYNGFNKMIWERYRNEMVKKNLNFIFGDVKILK
jgi:hypothetical protein